MNFLPNKAASLPPKSNFNCFNPIVIMPLPDPCFEDTEDTNNPSTLFKFDEFSSKNHEQKMSLDDSVEKMETESDGNDEIETNNLNSSCALTILNKSSIGQSLELDNDVFYEVSELDEKLNIEEATLNFLKSLNKPFVIQNQAFGFEEKNKIFRRKIKVRVGRRRTEGREQKLEKRKGNDWEGEEIFLHKLKKLKV